MTETNVIGFQNNPRRPEQDASATVTIPVREYETLKDVRDASHKLCDAIASNAQNIYPQVEGIVQALSDHYAEYPPKRVS